MRVQASSLGSGTVLVPNSEQIDRISSKKHFAIANCRCFYTLRLQDGIAVHFWGVYRLLLVFGTIRSFRSALAMQPNSQERRMMRRFDMRLPAIVRLEGVSEVHTETQNVSARGVFFYLDRAIEAGTKLEVTLTFPPHVTLTDAVRVRFNARVIRVESPLPSARVGTAAMIEDYEFLRSNGSPDFLAALQKEWKATN
jgi:hypothetical protein